MYNILFYEDLEGNKPVEDFIDRLMHLRLLTKTHEYNWSKLFIVWTDYRIKVHGLEKSLQRELKVEYGSYAQVKIVFCYLAGKAIS